MAPVVNMVKRRKDVGHAVASARQSETATCAQAGAVDEARAIRGKEQRRFRDVRPFT